MNLSLLPNSIIFKFLSKKIDFIFKKDFNLEKSISLFINAKTFIKLLMYKLDIFNLEKYKSAWRARCRRVNGSASSCSTLMV